jgi:hypothetical protein
VLPRLKQVEDCLSAEGIRALLYRASRVGGDGRGKRNTVALGGGNIKHAIGTSSGFSVLLRAHNFRKSHFLLVIHICAYTLQCVCVPTPMLCHARR